MIDGVRAGLMVCADAYSPEPARRLKNAGADLLVSAAAWWPGEWGPNGEWEARTLDTGLPLIVCNRTGHDGDTSMTDAESVFVDRGERVLRLQCEESTVFVVDCRIRDGHIEACDVIAAAPASLTPALPSESRPQLDAEHYGERPMSKRTWRRTARGDVS
jgi:hypothetical protein